MAKKEDFVLVEKKDLLKIQKGLLASSAALDDANDAINALTAGAPKVKKTRAPKVVDNATPTTEPADFDESPKASAAPSTVAAPSKKTSATVTPIKGGKAVVSKKNFAPAMPGKKAG